MSRKIPADSIRIMASNRRRVRRGLKSYGIIRPTYLMEQINCQKPEKWKCASLLSKIIGRNSETQNSKHHVALDRSIWILYLQIYVVFTKLFHDLFQKYFAPDDSAGSVITIVLIAHKRPLLCRQSPVHLIVNRNAEGAASSHGFGPHECNLPAANFVRFSFLYSTINIRNSIWRSIPSKI